MTRRLSLSVQTTRLQNCHENKAQRIESNDKTRIDQANCGLLRNHSHSDLQHNPPMSSRAVSGVQKDALAPARPR